MLDMFLYNWQIRDEWFNWCDSLPKEELIKKRMGGMGSILHNLYHVIDCEQIWINQMNDSRVIVQDITLVNNLKDVINFSNETKQLTKDFLKSWTPEKEQTEFNMTNKKGRTFTFTYGKIMLHIISHEIHHIGQLSVWSRELNLKPISSDLLFRDIN